ncbi:MAG TPA: aldehyde dehydrogenase (NADP(+)) [Opitutaceae bacterium]|nr:aldehyde dehydrogenase (NADP(+)) [Opitutaceae bacterium]
MAGSVLLRRMELRGLSLIGAETGVAGGATFQGFDPGRQAPLAPVFQSASPAELERAVQLAAEAAPVWAGLNGAARNRFLRLVADKLDQNVTELAARAAQETGLPVARCTGEVARTSGQLRLYGAAAETGDWLDARIETAQPDRKPLPKPDHRSMLRPLGPVVVFGSSNFPFAYSVAGGDTASAWAAGCPVIVKAHPAHPGTGELVGQLVVAAVKELGLPPGTFSLLFDAGFTVGQTLVKHPAVKAVGFTGSLRGGRALVDLAASRPEPIPVYAEMGSTNPVFILPGALAERSAAIVDGLHGSATQGVGQFCTNPGLVILERSAAAEQFVRALGAKLATTEAGPMLTPGIAGAFRQNVGVRAKQPGVGQLVGGEAGDPARIATLPPCAAQPVWFETEAATFLANHGLSEEIFGPSAVVVWCRDRAELLNVARHLEGSLTASLHAGGTEVAAQTELVDILAQRAGRLILNGYPTGLEVSHAIVHGGPYPATSDGGRSTSVGTRALLRWARLICYQNFADELLPPELRNANPLGICRLVNGQTTRNAV